MLRCYMDKTCCYCRETKPEIAFSPRNLACKKCNAARAKELRRKRKVLGLCACGQPAEEGKRACTKCLTMQRLRYADTRSYTARTGDKYGPTDKKKRPGRWAETPVDRACKSCGVVKPISEFQEQNFLRNEGRPTYRHVCYECGAKKSADRTAKYKSRGACSRCNERPASEGFLTCATCRESRGKYTVIARAEVLLRYGAKCNHCGDPRLQCLTFDHVGGWGKEHTTEKGRRITGYSLWKWARDNDYPDTIRLLCGSCHAALSFWKVLPKELPTFPRERDGSDKLVSVAPDTDVSNGLLRVALPEMPISASGPC